MNANATAARRHEHLISRALAQPLAGLPYHRSGPLERWLMAGDVVHPEANAHIAVHRVGPTAEERRSYCEEHAHTVAELNLILPFDTLAYDITLDDEHYVVHGPASVHIPPGVRHSANVRSGHGLFVAILSNVADYAKTLVPS